MVSSRSHTSIEVVRTLVRSRDQLDSAIEAAGTTTCVPWQHCGLPTDDFLVVRLMEIVVHVDDLASSTGAETPVFDPEVVEAVVCLLAALAVRRRGPNAVVRALHVASC